MATPSNRLQQQQRRQKSTSSVPRVPGHRLNATGTMSTNTMSTSLHTSKLELRPMASSTPLSQRPARLNLTAIGGVQNQTATTTKAMQVACGEGIFSKIRENVRIRPSAREGTIAVKSDENGRNIVCVGQEGGKISEFAVNTVLDAESTQQQVYEAVTAGLHDEFTGGKNVCTFAYGATGSGKTHSMLGTAEEPGIMPRFCCDLFHIIDTGKEGTAEFMLEVRFYELYQEKAYDLLADGGPLTVRGTGPFYLDKLTVVPVNKLSEVDAICDQGMRRRATAATLNNEMSSRSHAIFQLTLRRNHCDVLASGEELKSVVVSNCYFVDLAGSEGASDNLAESKAINQSLLTLGRVITAKSEGQPFFNYRDSLLTRLLQECFGGNSATSLLATISPEPKNVGSTLNTLRFACQAALVKQTPIVNVDPTVRELRELRERIEALRRENEQLLLLNSNKAAEQQSADNDESTHTRPIDQQLNSSHCWSHRPEPPCVVELLPDEALNVWTPLAEKATGGSEGFVELGGGVGDSPCVRLTSTMTVEGDKEPPSSGAMLRVLKVDAEVVHNGKLLRPDEETPLRHGDRLVVAGTRFLVFLGEPMPAKEKCLPTYHEVKLEYTEAITPLIQKRLVERVHEEWEEANRETVSKLNAQIEEQHRQIDNLKGLQERLEQEADAKEAAEISQKLASAKEQVEADEEMKEELHGALMNASRSSIAATERELSAEEKELLAGLNSRTATLNNIISFFHRERPKYHVKLTTSGDVVTPKVRMVDTKKRLYADLSPREFTQLYERAVELYGITAVAADGIAQLEDAVHDGEWVWKECAVGQRSNLFTTALYNCMHDVAERRGSSVAELDRSFRSRRSVITEVIDAAAKDRRRVESPLITQLNLIKDSPTVADADYDLPLTSLMLKALVRVADSLDSAATDMGEALGEDGRVKVGYEHEQAAIHSLTQFITRVESLRWLVVGVERYPTCDHVLDEMRALAAVIQRDARRWTMALAADCKSSEFFVRRVGINLKLLVRLIGRLSFFRDEKFPSDEKDTGIVNNRHEFEEGVMKSLEEACDDIAESMGLYKHQSSSTNEKSRVISILLKCIREVYTELQRTYDAEIDCELLRPLIRHKNKLIDGRSKNSWSSLHGKLKALKPVAEKLLLQKRGAALIDSGLNECLEILTPS